MGSAQKRGPTGGKPAAQKKRGNKRNWFFE